MHLKYAFSSAPEYLENHSTCVTLEGTLCIHAHSIVARVACTDCAASSSRGAAGENRCLHSLPRVQIWPVSSMPICVLARTEPGGRDLVDEVVTSFIVPGCVEDAFLIGSGSECSHIWKGIPRRTL